jgi:(p)ppGpp synthase/HD superfamily hydrolase
MTPRFTEAIHLAARAHEGQPRKGTPIPYITHPVAVAGLVAQYGGDENQQIAALLHDILEDGGPHYTSEIRAKFGKRVLSIVKACTDGAPDKNGKKADWEERKRAYLAHLPTVPDDALLVSACDKLSNARAILEDLSAIGPDVFDRFKGGKRGTLWYYKKLSKVFTSRGSPLADELNATVRKLVRRAK